MDCYSRGMSPFSLPVWSYLGSLRWPKLVLWFYLCWYATIVGMHFDPAPRLWLSSIGISGIIGFALVLSTTKTGQTLDGWTRFRLFLMPFCVSSYAALIKDRGFLLVFSPDPRENLAALAACSGFLALHLAARWWGRHRA